MIWTAWQGIIDALEGHRGEPFTAAATMARKWAKDKLLPISVDIEEETVVFRWQWQTATVSPGLVRWQAVKAPEIEVEGKDDAK